MSDKIRFLKHKVVNDTRGTSARVFYSLDNRTDGRKVVTLYAKDYSDKLGTVFPRENENNSDSMTDYFCKDTVRLFEDHPLYKEARKRANENNGIFEGEPKLVEDNTQLHTIAKEDLEVADTYIGLLSRLGVKQISVL